MFSVFRAFYQNLLASFIVCLIIPGALVEIMLFLEAQTSLFIDSFNPMNIISTLPGNTQLYSKSIILLSTRYLK